MYGYIIGGSKGGVGKSFVSIGLADYLTQYKKKEICLIETDTSNPDAAKILHSNDDEKNIEIKPVSLDKIDGWIELINTLERSQKDVVINTAARSIDGIKKFSPTLISVLDELKLELCSFWVINRQRDSLELLKEYSKTIPGTLHVVRNNYFGSPEQFDLYNSSALAKELSGRGKTLDFPDLADRVADDIYSKRLSIQKASAEMPLGNKAELNRWRNIMWKMFYTVLENAPKN